MKWMNAIRPARTFPRIHHIDKSRQEFMTKVILMVLTMVVFPFVLISFVGGLRGTIPWDTFVILNIMAVSFCLGWWMAQAGYWRISGYIPPIVCFCIGIYGNFVGGIDAPAMLLYALTIILSTMLQGGAVPFLALLLTLTAYLGMAFAYANGMLIQARSGDSVRINRITIVVAALVSVFFLLRFLVSQYHKAIEQSRKNAKDAQDNAEALRLREEQYRTLVETSPEPIVLYDLQGNLLTANRCAVEAYGAASPEDFCASIHNIVALVDEKEKPFIFPRLRQILDQPIPVRNEYHIRLKNGKKLIAEINTSVVRNPHGDPVGFISIILDISERKKAEEVLRLNAERSMSLLKMHERAKTPLPDIARFGLHEGIRLTRSTMGYIALIEQEKDAISLHVHSPYYCTGPVNLAIGATGPWQIALKECSSVLSNEPSSPDQEYSDVLAIFSSPQRHMDIPIRIGSHLALIIGVYGKEDPYDENDLQQLTLLMEGMWYLVEQKRAQEHLFIRDAAIASSISAIAMADLELKVTYANEASARLEGYAHVDEIIGAHVTQFLAQPEKAEEILQILIDHDAWSGELIAKKKNGVTYPVLAHINRVVGHDGQTLCFMGSFVDISERLQAEEAQRASERKYRELVENANSIILRIDPMGRVAFFNEYAERFFGFSQEEILGRNVVGSILPEYDSGGQPMERLVKAICAHPERFASVENENMRRSGERVWVAWTNRPIFDDANQLQEILCVGNDITERKRIEAQLRQAQKMEAVGQLAGGIAHDFNNLLQAIIGYGELMQLQAEPDDRGAPSLREILKAAERAANLTRQLLAFSRRQILEPRPIDLNEVVSEMIKMISRMIGEHIELEFIPGFALNTVQADRNQLEQVIMNLCLNARDAMPDGGRLILETENVLLDHAYCLAHAWARPGRYVLLNVTDTGHGMPPEVLSHIFEPFFTTKEVGKGTGLGLATVYGIIKQHEGLIHAYSEVGQGTAFKIYLNSVEHPVSSKDDALPVPVFGGNETILLAEDEEQVRELTQQILEGAGYSVLTACNGEEALQLFRQQESKIDMLLLDIVMPHLGGRAVYETIREDHPRIRCLFCSGYSESSIQHGIMPEQGFNILQKPYHPADLLRQVRKVLESKP